MAVIYDDSNFEELAERVLLKSLLVWVKLRYVVPLRLEYQKDELDTVQLIDKISNQQVVAVISDKDIWTIQKNVALFNIVSRAFAKHFMTDELYSEYGAIDIHADRKRADADISMSPAEYQGVWNEIIPCIMYVKPHSQIIDDYKHNGFKHDHQADIIPILKSKCNVFLTKAEHAVIDKAYDDFKADPQFVLSREHIETARSIEEKHLKAILKSIRKGNDSDKVAFPMTKLTLTIFTIVEMAYKHDAHKVLKIMNDKNTPVFDFTKLFIIAYPTDLEYIEAILRPVIDANIKIHVGKGRILFTTQSGVDPNDPSLNDLQSTLIVKSEEFLDHHFDTQVSAVASLADVDRIMERILQHKYKDYY